MKLGLSLALGSQRVGGGSPPPPAQFVTSINAEGWSAEATNPGALPAMTYTIASEMTPDTSPQTMQVTRPGFNASCLATTYVETRIFTKRKRQTWSAGLPNTNQPPATASTLVMDDFVYSTDITPINVVNNSTVASPKPFAAWVMPSRLLVGNSVHWEMIAFHRDYNNNRQVAAVRVRANDGTNQTAWQIVITTQVSLIAEDALPIEVFRGDIDITGLNTGAFWLEGEAYPWIGDANAVLKSEANWAAGASFKTFTRRYFHKDATRAASPPLAYVDPAGNDTTGIWSTNASTAAATPFLTVTGAHAAIMHATRGVPATGGLGTGCRIRIAGAVNTGSVAQVANPQGGAGVVIERAPGVSRGSAIWTLEGGYRPSMSCNVSGVTETGCLITDVTLKRTVAAATIRGEAAAFLWWTLQNITLIDASGTFGSPYSSSSGSFMGVIFDPTTTNFAWITETVNELRLFRGNTVDMNSTNLTEWVTIGNKVSRPGGVGVNNPNIGSITYNNKFLQLSGTPAAYISVAGAAAGDTVSNSVVLQNMLEFTGTGTNSGIRFSGDNGNGSINHLVAAHNTVAGFGSNGRQNLCYDESTGTNRRQHTLMRFSGNIWLQINTKGDVFVANNQANPTEAPNRTGQFQYMNGVGVQGEWTQFCSADGASVGSGFSPMFVGMGTSIGTSLTVRNDPQFVNYQATTSGPTAGAGNGDYHLQPGSGARNRVTRRALRYDLEGALRPTSGNDACGCYA